MKVIKKECTLEETKDTTLPYTCYVVSYRDSDNQIKYDLVVSSKKVEIFDYYWDLYRDNFIAMEQSEGRANPKLWIDPNAPKKGKSKGK